MTIFQRILLVVVGLTIATVVVEGQDPEITERILPEIKRMGVTGRLQCVVINQENNPVYWIHKATQTTISTDDKINVDDIHNIVVNGWPKYQVERTFDGKKTIYTIIVHRLEPRDAGNYTCQIIIRGSTRHPSKDGEMIVLIPPAIARSRTTHTVTIQEGHSFNMTCDASGHPKPNITWIRINGALLPNGQLKHQFPVFPLQAVTKNDRGVYRCIADNNVRPPAATDATILVQFKPEANPIQDTYGQAENRMFDLTIECRISGYPDPDLKWFKVQSGGGLQQVINDDKHTINILLNHANILEANERWLQMVIRAVQANDYGDYVCEGRNNLGVGQTKIRVFATSECQGPNCPTEQNMAMTGNAQPIRSRSRLTVSTTFTLAIITLSLFSSS